MANVVAADLQVSARWRPQPQQKVDDGAAATTRVEDGDALAGGDVKGGGVVVMVGQAQGPGPHIEGCGAADGHAFVALDVEFDQMSKLVDGGQQVVGRLQLLVQLDDAPGDGSDDELGRHQLPDGQGAIDDEGAADAQQSHRRPRLQREAADGLAQQDAKLSSSRRQVGAGGVVGAGQAEAASVLGAKHGRMAHEFLQPVCDAVLGVALVDAALYAADAEAEDHDDDAKHETHREHQQQRAVDRQDAQPDQEFERQRHALQQQRCQDFLDRDDVKEAVDQLAGIPRLFDRRRHPRQPPGEVGHQPHKDAPLHHLDHEELQGPHPAASEQGRGQQHAQHHQRLQQGLGRDGADESLHRQRRRQRQQADNDAIDNDDADVGAFQPHQRQHPPPR